MPIFIIDETTLSTGLVPVVPKTTGFMHHNQFLRHTSDYDIKNLFVMQKARWLWELLKMDMWTEYNWKAADTNHFGFSSPSSVKLPDRTFPDPHELKIVGPDVDQLPKGHHEIRYSATDEHNVTSVCTFTVTVSGN